MEPVLVALIALQLADAASTYLAIKAGAHEANPLVNFVRRFLPGGKWAWLAWVKLPVIAMLAYVANFVLTEADRELYYALVIGYVLVVANNLNIWRKLRSK